VLAIKGSFRQIVLMYAIAQMAAILIGAVTISQIPVQSEASQPSYAGTFLLYILIATAVFLILARFFPRGFRWLLAALEIFFLWGTSTVMYSLFLPETAATIAGIVTAVLRAIFWRSSIAQNVSTLIIAAVSTAVVGLSVAPAVAVLLLAIMATYDFISVFVTKHMVTLAKALGARERGSGEIHMLGTGDIVIPGIVAVSLLRVGILPAVLSALGALIGLITTIWLARRWKRILPALPSIGVVQLALSAVGLCITAFL